jgi:hypothetical protein
MKSRRGHADDFPVHICTLLLGPYMYFTTLGSAVDTPMTFREAILEQRIKLQIGMQLDTIRSIVCKMETIDDSTTFPPTKDPKGDAIRNAALFGWKSSSSKGKGFLSDLKSRRGLIYVPKQLPFGTVPAAWLHL